MAHALRAGVRAGIIQAILVVARKNKNDMPPDDLSRQYQQQVDLMLRKAEREDERIQIFNQQVPNDAPRRVCVCLCVCVCMCVFVCVVCLCVVV
jgi:hypothetical protein